MPDEVTFFDLVTLMKIKPGITVERYGGLINSSFFDGAKVLGTLQQKKLISLTTAMPDQNPITVTDTGKQLIAEAEDRGKQEFDHLDLETLIQVSKGKSTPEDLGKSVNVRPKDLAMHLYRLTKQDYATYELVSGNVNIMLTEKGFAQSKAGMPAKPQPQPPMQPQMAQQTPGMGPTTAVPQPPEMMNMQKPAATLSEMGMTPPVPDQSGQTVNAPEAPTPETEHKSYNKRNAIIFLVIILILAVIGYLYYTHSISLP